MHTACPPRICCPMRGTTGTASTATPGGRSSCAGTATGCTTRAASSRTSATTPGSSATFADRSRQKYEPHPISRPRLNCCFVSEHPSRAWGQEREAGPERVAPDHHHQAEGKDASQSTFQSTPSTCQKLILDQCRLIILYCLVSYSNYKNLENISTKLHWKHQGNYLICFQTFLFVLS